MLSRSARQTQSTLMDGSLALRTPHNPVFCIMNPTALVGGPLEAPLDGRYQPGVLIGDDQLDSL